MHQRRTLIIFNGMRASTHRMSILSAAILFSFCSFAYVHPRRSCAVFEPAFVHSIRQQSSIWYASSSSVGRGGPSISAARRDPTDVWAQRPPSRRIRLMRTQGHSPMASTVTPFGVFSALPVTGNAMYFSQGPVLGGDVHMKARVMMLEAELGRKQAEVDALRAAYESLSSSAAASSATCARQDEELAVKQQQLDEANLRLAQQQDSIEQMAAQLQQVTADLAAETEKHKKVKAAAADTQEQLGYVQQALEASRDEVYSLQAACLDLKTAMTEAQEAAAAAADRAASLAQAAEQLQREKRDLVRWMASAAEEAEMARAAAAAAGRGEAAVLVVMATLAQQHADNKKALQKMGKQLEKYKTKAAETAQQLKQAVSHNELLVLEAGAAEAARQAAVKTAESMQNKYECIATELRLTRQHMLEFKARAGTAEARADNAETRASTAERLADYFRASRDSSQQAGDRSLKQLQEAYEELSRMYHANMDEWQRLWQSKMVLCGTPLAAEGASQG